MGEYLPQLKVSAQLLTPEVEATFGANDALKLEADLSNIPESRSFRSLEGLSHRIGREVVPTISANVKVVLFDEAGRDQAMQRLQALPGVGVIETIANTILVTSPGDAIIKIAALPNVKSVEPNLQAGLHNNISNAYHAHQYGTDHVGFGWTQSIRRRSRYGTGQAEILQPYWVTLLDATIT